MKTCFLLKHFRVFFQQWNGESEGKFERQILQFKINSCTGTDKALFEEWNCYFKKRKFGVVQTVQKWCHTGCSVIVIVLPFKDLPYCSPSTSVSLPRVIHFNALDEKRAFKMLSIAHVTLPELFVNSKHDCWKNICRALLAILIIS